MRRVLMVSPQFPPDTSAGAHRVRLLAPHLPQYDWFPTVVTLTPDSYESKLDPELACLVPGDLRVVRCRAWPPAITRRFGMGDLGIRAFGALRRACSQLLATERFDALFITIYPTYTAVLGPMLKRRFGVPFVLDYQDPWVGAWGKTVGGGGNGTPDIKSRVFRAAGEWLEPRVVAAADAITAVSAGTYEEIRERNPQIRTKHCAAIPLGGDAADFDYLRCHPRANPFFEPKDGNVHLCYVGTLLPLGFETLRAVLKAARMLRESRPQSYCRLRMHFFGTSNQRVETAPERVLPVAEELGVLDCVSERAPRIDYLQALQVQQEASAILLMGSSERHYTASKLYPALLAQRPLLAIYHEASSVVEVLQSAARSSSVRVITYNDKLRAESRVENIFQQLASLITEPIYTPADINFTGVQQYSAQRLAGQLAAVLSAVASHTHAL
jgi:hypothetical protein